MFGESLPGPAELPYSDDKPVDNEGPESAA